MQPSPQELPDLAQEHEVLLRGYGRAQARCSDLLHEQAQTIARLQAQAMRLRAAVIVRDSALAWEREDRLALERAAPGLPRRQTLARRVDDLLARVQELMRQQLTHNLRAPSRTAALPLPPDPEALEASLRAADLVICQTGCVSHGDYWRVQDHCRRTGKTCVLVDQPDALAIVQVQTPEQAATR